MSWMMGSTRLEIDDEPSVESVKKLVMQETTQTLEDSRTDLSEELNNPKLQHAMNSASFKRGLDLREVRLK